MLATITWSSFTMLPTRSNAFKTKSRAFKTKSRVGKNASMKFVRNVIKQADLDGADNAKLAELKKAVGELLK
jgi:hypothetical protein